MKKNTNNRNFIKTAIFALTFLIFAGCSGYLENPMKDNETGEDINLLILDFNFFTTRMTFKFFDAKDSSVITLPANVKFSGANGNDIVTFAGEKNDSHSTMQGQLELTIDPNVEFSAANPFEFAIDIKVNGYNEFQKGFQIVSEGKKTYELYLSKPADDNTDLEGNVDEGDSSIVFILPPTELLKSATVAKPYEVHYKIAKSDFLLLKNTSGELIFNSIEELNAVYGTSGFAILSMNIVDDFAPGVDMVYYGGELVPLLFHKLEQGELVSFTVNGETVGDLNGITIKSYSVYTGAPVPDLFGFADFNSTEGGWFYHEPDADSAFYQSLDISYTVAEASTETLCETGSSITFSSSVISSFSIDADVYDENGTLINTINFKGNFPETFTVENAPSRAVKLVFRDNNTSFQAIPDLEIANLCTGSYNVTVQPEAGYEEYQIVLKAICPDNPTVAIAPSYSAEIRIKNSGDLWQGVDMTGGKVDMLGKPNQEYELRLLWKEEWEYSTYSTIFNATDGSYEGDAYPETVIESGYIENGARIRINVEKEFNQNVCDDMGW